VVAAADDRQAIARAIDPSLHFMVVRCHRYILGFRPFAEPQGECVACRPGPEGARERMLHCVGRPHPKLQALGASARRPSGRRQVIVHLPAHEAEAGCIAQPHRDKPPSQKKGPVRRPALKKFIGEDA